MLNILANEHLKLRRSKLLAVCSFIALTLPIFMIIVDFLDRGSIVTKLSGNEWVLRMVIPIQVLIYPILSGFVCTFLIQREYAEKTLINTMTAPTSREKFLLGKFLIWSCWVIVITFGFLGIIFMGFNLLYSEKLFQESIWQITEIVLKTGLLSLLSMTPILIVSVLQKNVFYPSLLFSCFVSGIGFSGLYWPETLRNMIPWSAVTSLTILNTQSLVPYISILISTMIGLLFGLHCFKTQDL